MHENTQDTKIGRSMNKEDTQHEPIPQKFNSKAIIEIENVHQKYDFELMIEFDITRAIKSINNLIST